MTLPTPFLKWAGGKRSLLPDLTARMPATFGTYHEPFIGGGALFFHTRPEHAILSDANLRLVRTYRAVRDRVEDVIALLRSYPHDRDFYAHMRTIDIDACPEDHEVAAWFIYLNKCGFNGLYRVNRAGRFNVPFGRYTRPTICDADNLRACSTALTTADLRHCDFEAAVAHAHGGDFVYFDPPYLPVSSTSRFATYTAEGFGMADHVRLRHCAHRLKSRGVHILLSNASVPSLHRLYGQGFRVDEIPCRRAINARADKRGPVTEVLIR